MHEVNGQAKKVRGGLIYISVHGVQVSMGDAREREETEKRRGGGVIGFVCVTLGEVETFENEEYRSVGLHVK